MGYPFGETVYRDRKATVANPYNPARPTGGDWDPELTIEIKGAYVAPSSSTSSSTATREQKLLDKSLFITDLTADVQPGDRIRTASIPFDGGVPYYVHVRPLAEVNPFTGWSPGLEIPLEMVEG